MPSRKAGLGFILVIIFLDVFGLGLIAPILPRLVKSFTDDAERGAFLVGALTAAYAAMQFLFSPVLGSVSDRFGRRPVLLVALFGSGFDYLLLTFAPSLGWFFLGRVVSGISGASIGTAMAYIADVSPPEKRAQNFGLIGAAFGLGFVAGPLLSAFLGTLDLTLPLVGEVSGLRVPFLVAAILTLINASYGLFVLPESLVPGHRRPFQWARANPFGTLRVILQHPLVAKLSVVFLLVGLAQRMLESTWVLYVDERYGWGLKQTGISLTVVGLSVGAIQGGLVRRIIPRFGEEKTVLGGLLIMIAGFVAYGLAPVGAVLYALIPFASLGYVSGPAVQGLTSKAMPADEQGLLQGGLASVTSLTSIFGPLLATGLFGFFTSPQAPVHLSGAAFFAGALLLLGAFFVARGAFTRGA